MKYIVILLTTLFVYSASAQISFNTGSAKLDTDLNTINTRADLDFGSFKADLSLQYNISEKKIDYMKTSLNMASGEIYLTLEISRLSKVSEDHVITIYQKHKNKGWGYIAKEVGIKPGSAEFHQLKNNASKNKYKGQNKNKGKVNRNDKRK